MDNIELIKAQAERIAESRILGRSDQLRRLFDFLVERAGEATPPREIDVAQHVFGRVDRFDASLDATVRVYVHRLRRKLDDFYAGPGRQESQRLIVPKGEYRLTLEAQAAEAEPAPLVKPRLPRWAMAAAVIGLLTLNGLAWAALALSRPSDPLDHVRASPIWAPMAKDTRPTVLVLGDYYIFGEADPETMEVKRLIREYSINSRDELDSHLLAHEDMTGRYVDLDLHYLPVASAMALRDLAPLLAPRSGDPDRLQTVLASDLTPEMLKSSNLVYVGYLSGLGMLRDPTFAGSRFRVGDTYDELIDSSGKKVFVSQAGGEAPAQGGPHRDYAYFSTFTGPSGNRIIIVAGTRDVAVMELAEAISRRPSLDALVSKAGGAQAFEALYEVEGLGRTNIHGELVAVSPLKTERIWNAAAQAARVYPEG